MEEREGGGIRVSEGRGEGLYIMRKCCIRARRCGACLTQSRFYNRRAARANEREGNSQRLSYKKKKPERSLDIMQLRRSLQNAFAPRSSAAVAAGEGRNLRDGGEENVAEATAGAPGKDQSGGRGRGP